MLQTFEDRKDYMIYFWDLEKNAYRQFHVSRFEGVTSFTQTNNRADVRQLNANTFVYDDTQSLDNFLTPAQVETINDDLEAAFSDGIPLAVGTAEVRSTGTLEF